MSRVSLVKVSIHTWGKIKLSVKSIIGILVLNVSVSEFFHILSGGIYYFLIQKEMVYYFKTKGFKIHIIFLYERIILR